MKRCAIEAARREQLLAEGLRDKQFLKPMDAVRLTRIVHRLTDVALYVERARRWQQLTFASFSLTNEGVRDWVRSREARTADRYVQDGHTRCMRLLKAFRPLEREAASRKAACGTWLAHVSANRRLRELDPSFGEPIKFPGYTPPAANQAAVSSENPA